MILEHHTKRDSKAEFDRFKFADSRHRVALLVARGVEGWDVPALFACALARRISSGANNFVLQAACRCLRQVPGNSVKARIYLSQTNRTTLDNELRENYGEQLSDLDRAKSTSKPVRLVLRKVHIPPICVTKVIKTVVRKDVSQQPLVLSKLDDNGAPVLEETVYDISLQVAQLSVLKQLGDTVEVHAAPRVVDRYTAAVELAANYRLDVWTVYDELVRLYDSEVPLAHLRHLREGIEQCVSHYEVRTETIQRALALVKLDEKTGEPVGWRKDVDESGVECYVAEINYPLSKERLLERWEELRDKAGGQSYHYEPYDCDSNSERDYLEKLLEELKLPRDEVEGIYFTGAVTSPKQTDFHVEYKDDDGKWRRYTPDFVVRRNDGVSLIVEIKGAHLDQKKTEDKRMALERLVDLNPDRLRYQLILADSGPTPFARIQEAVQFVEA